MSSSSVHANGVIGKYEKADGLFLPLDPKFWEQEISSDDIEFLCSVLDPDVDVMRKKVDDIQREAYAIFPYPCIRIYHFVRCAAAKVPIYSSVLEAGRKGNTVYLDVGCCMGTDVRKLVKDGYPAQNVYSTDLKEEYIDLGKKLYGGSNGITFFQSNVFDIPLPEKPVHEIPPNVTQLAQLQGKVTHIYTGAFFHLFDEEQQFDAAMKLASMLDRKPGAILYGRHWADPNTPHNSKFGNWLHTPKSWGEMWQKVFTKLESAEFARDRVRVEAVVSQGYAQDIMGGLDDGLPEMLWSIRLI